MDTTHGNGSDGRPFTSLTDLNNTHTSLLKKRGEEFAVGFLDEVEDFLRRGSALGVYLDTYDERAAGQSLLDYWVTVLYRARRTPPNATLADFDPTLSPVLDDSLCPYRGLNAFQEEDRDLFFGRQRLVELLVAKARSHRLLFVVGPSGSGKSSLVLAGLIPRLKVGGLEGSEDWRYFPRLVPGSNPLHNLAKALRKFYGQPAEWAAEQERELRDNSQHLVQLMAETGDAPAMLVVDQFEELFTLCLDDDARTAFIENLVALSASPDTRHLVALTMRTDYETFVAQVPGLQELFEEGQFRVTPLTAADLRQAIEEPARHIGLRFEAGIVDALVKDILGEPAGLPLLQFTLLRLWKMREGGRNRITWSVYTKLGGARRALALTADEFYQSLPEEKKETARRILLRMVRPSGIAEVVSNRVKRSSLSFEAQYRIDEVLAALHAAGLVRITQGDKTGDDQIEVAHEALVRNWPLLVDWVEKDRVSMRQRLQLTAYAENWLEHGKDPGALLAGKLLREALNYDPEELNDLEREFMQASAEAEEAQEREKREAQEREQELLQARAMAAEERAAEAARSARRLRLLVACLIVFVVSSTGLSVFASRQSSLARSNEHRATESEKKAEAALKNAEEERQKAQRLLEEAKKANAEANEAKTEAQKQGALAVSKSQEVDRKNQELKVALGRETQLRKDNTRLLSIDNEREKKRAQLAEMHRQADSTIVQDPGKAATLFEQLWENYRSSKDFDADGQKAQSALSGLAKAYHKLSVKRRLDSDERSAADSKAYEKLYQEKYKQALDPIESKLKGLEAKAGKDDPAIIPVLEERAQFYEYQEDRASALADYNRALDIQEQVIKKKGPDGQVSLRGLIDYEMLSRPIVNIYRDQYRYDELEELYERLIAMQLSVPYYAKSYEVYSEHNTLARLYGRSRNWPKAEKHYRAALDLVLEVFKTDPDNPKNPYVGSSLKNLAGILASQSKQEKKEEARDLYTRALKIVLSDKSKTNSPDEAEIREGLAEVYYDLKDVGEKNVDEAEKNYQRAIEIYKSDLQQYQPNLDSIMWKLGYIYVEQGKLDKAEPVYRELVSLNAKSPSDELRALRSLADVHVELGRDRDAESEYSQIQQLGQKLTSKVDFDYYQLRMSIGLAKIYSRRQDFLNSEAQAKKALELAEKYGYPPVVIEALNNFARVYQDQGKYAAAEEKYKKALDGSNSFPDEGTFGRWKLNTLENYAGLLKLLNRVDEAEKLLAQAQRVKENLQKPTPN